MQYHWSNQHKGEKSDEVLYTYYNVISRMSNNILERTSPIHNSALLKKNLKFYFTINSDMEIFCNPILYSSGQTLSSS